MGCAATLARRCQTAPDGLYILCVARRADCMTWILPRGTVARPPGGSWVSKIGALVDQSCALLQMLQTIAQHPCIVDERVRVFLLSASKRGWHWKAPTPRRFRRRRTLHPACFEVIKASVSNINIAPPLALSPISLNAAVLHSAARSGWPTAAELSQPSESSLAEEHLQGSWRS